MYHETYEEYIRSILGYPSQPMANMMPNNYMMNPTMSMNSQLENYYPEVYKVLYPMVRKICMNSGQNLTREQIENMTDEIYTAFENAENRGADTEENAKTTEKQENREEDRNIRNNPLTRDLIKILILRELLGNSRPPMRPPRPGGPNPRPPFGPGFPGGTRPPMMPRSDYYPDLYE